MMLIKHFVDEAFDKMLPFYGFKHKFECRKAMKQDALHAAAKVIVTRKLCQK